MSNITITVTEIVDGVSVESTPQSITVFDGVIVTSGGGGGGAVNSVNGHTGTVVLGAADVGAATAAQGALADTAVQPGALGTAAALNVPATGNATTSQVVKGTDTRLTDARTPTTHTHAETDITGLTTDLSTKAPLVSPAFTGNPTAPTQTAGNNSTRIATTAFVTAAVAAGGGGGGTGTVDTVVAGTGISVNATDPANPVVSASIGTASGTVAAGNDSRFTDARTPTAHASTHASAGSDPITIAESQVTNLTTDLAAKVAKSTVTAKGDLIVGTASAAVASQGIGTNGQVLTADSTQTNGLKWATPSSGFADPTTTKGDLIVHGSSTTRLGVGTDGQVLTADSAQTNGVKWATPSGGGGSAPLPGWVAGQYYSNALLTNASTGAASSIGGVGELAFIPIWVPAAGASIDRISLECTVTGVSAAIRVGIYNDSNGKPGTLLNEFGVLDASATGERAAVDTQALSAGQYWLAYLVETQAGTWRMQGSSATFLPHLGYPGATSTAGGSGNRFRAGGVTTGALPSTAPTMTVANDQYVRIVARAA